MTEVMTEIKRAFFLKQHSLKTQRSQSGHLRDPAVTLRRERDQTQLYMVSRRLL